MRFVIKISDLETKKELFWKLSELSIPFKYDHDVFDFSIQKCIYPGIGLEDLKRIHIEITDVVFINIPTDNIIYFRIYPE